MKIKLFLAVILLTQIFYGQTIDRAMKSELYNNNIELIGKGLNSSSEKKVEVSYVGNKTINKDKLDDLLNRTVNNHGIGSLSIFRNGIEVYYKNFGQEQIKSNTYSESPKYQIGSISKLMTAVMLLQLVEDKKLQLSDKLSKFYPEIPNAKKITIGNMLNHTSGLGDYVGETNFIFGKSRGNKAIISKIKSQGVSFQPGEKVEYSNSAYFLLSRILEKIKKKPYNIILKENILSKVRMYNTLSVLDNPKNVSKSYEYKDGKWINIQEFNFHNCIGLGDVVSTTKDLNVFINALFNNHLIKKETLEIMMPKKDEKNYGRGIEVIPFHSIPSYGHGGATVGTYSLLSYEPTEKLSLAISMNVENFPHNDLYIEIFKIIYDQDN